MTEKPKIKINKDEWTPERFLRELIDSKSGVNKPFTPENKAALYSLTREEAILLDPRIYARWRMKYDNKEITLKAGASSGKRRTELKDWSQKIRCLLNDPELTTTMINQRKMPKWMNALDDGSGKTPTPADVIAATLMAKAMTGDVRAIEELRKMGFGDKVTIDAGESFFNKSALKLEIVDTSDETKRLAATEFNTEPEPAKAAEPVEPPKPIEKPTETPKEEPEPVVKDLQPIPPALKEEFDKQEEELKELQATPKNPNINEHGIDRSILNKVVITKNKHRS